MKQARSISARLQSPKAGRRRNITDRGFRYRANANAPDGPKQCGYCGTKSGLIEVEHINGKEQDTSPENLIWACRSCNVLKANTTRKRGMGRLTHQYNPGAKTLQQWLAAVSVITPHKDRGSGSLVPSLDNQMSVADAVEMIRATPRSRRSAFARDIRSRKSERSRSNPLRQNLWPFSSPATSPRNTTPASGGIAAHSGKLAKRQRIGTATKYKGHAITPTSEGFQAMDSEFDTLRDAKRFIDAWVKRNPDYRRNPAEASAQAYEEFHGRPSSETVTVSRRVHTHRHLASAGELRALVVKAIDGKHRVTVRFSKAEGKQTFLAFNEKRNQLFVEGGDQGVALEDFGIKRPHELETLGRVEKIDYFTEKDHLGDEGGAAVYRHHFRMTNQDGKHVTIRIARYPDLIYRVLDKQMEFSGGSYEILAEGIDR